MHGYGHEYAILIIYVDYVLLIGSSKGTKTHLRDQLTRLFDIINFSPVQHLLGMDIARHGQHLAISQSRFVRSIITEFQMRV